MADPTVMSQIISTTFETDGFSDGLQWFSPPSTYQSKVEHGAGLRINMDPKTDFWQRTYYEPELRADNGHFLYVPTQQNKIYAETEFNIKSSNKFDQAGLMLRLDADNWVKTGLEYSDGAWRLSCVVTNHNSDWSTTAWKGSHLKLRLYRLGESVVVEAQEQGGSKWEFIRIAHLSNPQNRELMIGIFACSPTDIKTASVVFNYLTVKQTTGFHHTN